MTFFDDQFRDRRVLITGDTGFKGSWLALWLTKLGAEVTGVSLDPLNFRDHWNHLDLKYKSIRADIRNFELINSIFKEINPQIIFHLAAQPLVRKSYASPLETWGVNTLGTANVLEASRTLTNLAGVVVVTTDKVYENKEWNWGYREIDPILGHDPYSASKAASELVINSYRSSLNWSSPKAIIASARAGNVIGGGDWSEDRLIPDICLSYLSNKPLEVRSPKSTRPWQHVLDCLSGYLLLGSKILSQDLSVNRAWNFGPDSSGNKSVQEILEKFCLEFPEFSWKLSQHNGPHESKLLFLDTSDAISLLDWRPVWEFDKSINMTAIWYRHFLNYGEIISETQLNEYLDNAITANSSWISH